MGHEVQRYEELWGPRKRPKVGRGSMRALSLGPKTGGRGGYPPGSHRLEEEDGGDSYLQGSPTLTGPYSQA